MKLTPGADFTFILRAAFLYQDHGRPQIFSRGGQKFPGGKQIFFFNSKKPTILAGEGGEQVPPLALPCGRP